MNKSTFSVEAIISCDERGQLVLPKEIRKRLDIAPGEKLALINYTTEDKTLCLTIIRANSLEEVIKSYLKPVMKEMIK